MSGIVLKFSDKVVVKVFMDLQILTPVTMHEYWIFTKLNSDEFIHMNYENTCVDLTIRLWATHPFSLCVYDTITGPNYGKQRGFDNFIQCVSFLETFNMKQPKGKFLKWILKFFSKHD